MFEMHIKKQITIEIIYTLIKKFIFVFTFDFLLISFLFLLVIIF